MSSIRFATLLLMLSLTVFAADFNAVLTAVSAYEYGDSREKLSELSDMLRAAAGDAQQLAAYEQAMLTALASPKTTFAAKQYLCKELSIMGSAAAVPTLSKMLYDPRTADIARYALERIPGEDVDKALLKALGKTKGLVQVGVINTLGERKTLAAQKPLAKLLKNKDTQVAAAAAAALGKMGTSFAAENLAAAQKIDALRPAAVDAFLHNADLLCKAGQVKEAESAYRLMFSPDQPTAVRSAALVGLVKTVDNPTELLISVLRSEPKALKAVAAGLVHQSCRTIDVKAVVEELPKLPAETKLQLLTALRLKGDTAARENVLQALDDEDPEVCAAAAEALATLGRAEDVPRLALLAATAAEPVKSAAKTSLARLNSPGTDDAMLTAMETAEGPVLQTLIETLGERNLAAVPKLLSLTQHGDRRVRVAAFKSLGLVASPADLPALIDALIACSGDAERREAERTVVAVSRKVNEKQAGAAIAAMPKATSPEARASLLLVIGRLGDAEGLPILMSALKDKNVELQRAAVVALSEWPTPEPLNDLLDAAKNLKDETLRVLALRGFITLVGRPCERPKSETTALYKTALDLAQNAAEKRQALSGLAKVYSAEAFDLAARYLDDPETAAEAELAVVENAVRLGEQKTEARKNIIRRIGERSTDERIKRAVESILQ